MPSEGSSADHAPRREVDLRSDTVTQPTPEMRRAMAEAEVGDDVFGEDPTVNALQERVARMCGLEAALYVPSGSMDNLVSLRAMAQPGDEVICHELAHILHYEVASLAAVAGVQAQPLPGARGILDPEAVERAIRPPMYTFPRTAVIAIENTHNLCGGSVWALDDVRAMRKVADDHGLSLYMDGARVLNACVATGTPLSEYAGLVDGMSFCFSKGLGAPVGSIVVGPEKFVEACRRFRKMHGGGMRQAGVLAAACLVALDTMVDRLAEDHRNARRLAEGIAALAAEAADPKGVETNIVLVRTEPLGFAPAELVAALRRRGVRVLAYRSGGVRMVTHNGVSAEDVEYVLEVFGEIAR